MPFNKTKQGEVSVDGYQSFSRANFSEGICQVIGTYISSLCERLPNCSPKWLPLPSNAKCCLVSCVLANTCDFFFSLKKADGENDIVLICSSLVTSEVDYFFVVNWQLDFCFDNWIFMWMYIANFFLLIKILQIWILMVYICFCLNLHTYIFTDK